MSDAIQHWQFDPLDTWFFREERGFDASGSNELSSLFPPPARTVAGAIRTLIGERQGVDWAQFAASGECADLKAIIGLGDDLGALRLTGPYPLLDGERLYPVPLHLLGKDDAYRFLAPGSPVRCDLGVTPPLIPDSSLPRGKGAETPIPSGESGERGWGEGRTVQTTRILSVKLPALADPLPGAKPLEQGWLTRDNLQRVLRGQPPQPPTAVIDARDLYAEEPRLGIARNNARRTGIDGLLYQTRHLRPRAGLAIGVGVQGLPSDWQPVKGMVRLGGEGRASAVSNGAPPASPIPPAPPDNRLLLMLLTHADFGRDWFPPGFRAEDREGVRVWRGEIRGVALTIECAVIGKAAREGGWDLVTERPRPVKSLIPAGSVYFCTVAGDAQAAVQALQGQRLGHDRALGRGELAIGIW